MVRIVFRRRDALIVRSSFIGLLIQNLTFFFFNLLSESVSSLVWRTIQSVHSL